MNDQNENIPNRHRFGDDYAGPLTLREFMRDANFWVIAVIIAVAGFWTWVGYNVAGWLP